MENQYIDLVDFHSHILPGVDHGSASLEQSLGQLKMAEEAGVKRIFATSHFYPNLHTVKSFVEKRNKAYCNLINSNVYDVEIKLGAEVLLCNNLHKLENLSSLCISGTKYLLVELPFGNISDVLIYEVKKLIHDGYMVILAHADRYSKNVIERLVDFGAQIQLNASSLSTFLKNKSLYSWIERGLVVGIGSDIHGIDKKAYKCFVKAKKKLDKNLQAIANESDFIWGKSTDAYANL